MIKIAVTMVSLLLSTAVFASSTCSGRYLNPFTDICWSCLFPLTLGGESLNISDNPDTKNPKKAVCYCQKGEIPQVGLTFGFWEPARISEVTRTPFCMPALGGNILPIHTSEGQGGAGISDAGQYHSFYEVHWYIYPLLAWMEVLSDTLCVEQDGFDVGYMTEFDPTWRDENLSFILNPEAVLFSSKPLQLACGSDCVAATTHLPIDDLYWCAGCQGSMYPLTGTVANHIGGVQASVLLTERMGFKLHRMGLEFGTSGNKALCYNYSMPIMEKSQYRLQMVYPKAITHSPEGCNPYGRSTTLWEQGKEYPVSGEDFAYLIWRKRNCCAL